MDRDKSYFLLSYVIRYIYMYVIYKAWGFPGGSVVKNLPMQETLVGFLGWENPLEEGLATHYTILAVKLHGQRSLAGYIPWVSKTETQLGD